MRTELGAPREEHKPDDDEPIQMTLPDTLPGARQVNIYDALEEQAA